MVLSALPPDFAAPILVCQHVFPDLPSQLAELLSRRTPLCVKQAAEGDRLKPGWVYVTPSGRHLLVWPDGRLILPPALEAGLGRPSADLLFSSLAHVVGRRAVAAVLTGTGWDGSAGVRVVKAAGGITIAQDVESSLFPSMPRCAAETGAVDHVLPLTGIAAALMDLTRPVKPSRNDRKQMHHESENHAGRS